LTAVNFMKWGGRVKKATRATKGGSRRESGGIAILGAGNLGMAIARGVVRSGFRAPGKVHLVRRRAEELDDFLAQGFGVGTSNLDAVGASRIIVLAVLPRQIPEVLREIGPALDSRKHLLVSTATGVTIARIREVVGGKIPVVRAMPNLGIQTLDSMTCLAHDELSSPALPEVEALFGGMGETVTIAEERMAAATALCASGIAFFLRAIRAAAQGGTETGFHAEEALRMAAQTAKGAAVLLLSNGTHPEAEIDQVTTPNGCTIAGLNRMESLGFSSALTQGVVAAERRARELNSPPEGSQGG
jgi:pyrroline-5-carboxylate reductase